MTSQAILTVIELAASVLLLLSFAIWKTVLNPISRMILLYRSRKREVSSKRDDTFVYRNTAIDKVRYLNLRGDYFNMRMNYNPSSAVINRHIRKLKRKLKPVKQCSKREAIQADLDVLERMKHKLDEGDVMSRNYYSYLDDKFNLARVPVWAYLLLALVTLFYAYPANMILLPVFIGTFGGLIMLVCATLLAERVLRHSRQIIYRGIAHSIQIVTLAGVITYISYLFMLLTWLF